MRKKQVVTIGGGTGSFMVLSELKKYDNLKVTAVVNMTDAGGSTGLLRDELGVLPAGDARQALVALSESEKQWRDLFVYRFTENSGGLSGHNFGNLFLGVLEKTTGSFEKALEQAGDMLKTKGRVVPITLDDSQLIIETHSDEVFYGEGTIDESVVANPRSIYFNKPTKLNSEAKKAIEQADIIIVCPGNFYCSIMPNLLISGMHHALAKSRAHKVFVANLVSKYGHTTDMTVVDFVHQAHRAIDLSFIDTVIYNTQTELTDKKLVEKYAADGEHLILPGELESLKNINLVGQKLITKELASKESGDTIKRSLIRHDAKKLVDIILKLI